MSSSFGCGLGPPLALVVSGSGAGVGATGAGLGAALASSLVEGLQAVRTRAAVSAEPSRRKRIGCMHPVWPDEVARKQGFSRGGNIDSGGRVSSGGLASLRAGIEARR